MEFALDLVAGLVAAAVAAWQISITHFTLFNGTLLNGTRTLFRSRLRRLVSVLALNIPCGGSLVVCETSTLTAAVMHRDLAGNSAEERADTS